VMGRVGWGVVSLCCGEELRERGGWVDGWVVGWMDGWMDDQGRELERVGCYSRRLDSCATITCTA